jgi:hypothetical protein
VYLRTYHPPPLGLHWCIAEFVMHRLAKYGNFR